MPATNDNGAILADELNGWFLRELPYTGWLKEQYVKWDDDGIMAHLNVDFNTLYREYFDMDYDYALEKEPDSFYGTGLLILLAWQALLKPEYREAFVTEINQRLKYFEAPIRLTPHGRFHEVLPDMADYDDASVYKSGRYDTANVIFVVVVVLIILLLFFNLSMGVTEAIVPPSLL